MKEVKSGEGGDSATDCVQWKGEENKDEHLAPRLQTQRNTERQAGEFKVMIFLVVSMLNQRDSWGVLDAAHSRAGCQV